ncbi:Reverse transcriptase (RNA-dependent DNA polymerase) [Popillia japonica]|uniref:Reverse transcriptase (RNA-dependent DNA polymerase) n=1 Tax=Popillia japonica TaxID=7064 RepID=A0AAW1HQM2_POPJA
MGYVNNGYRLWDIERQKIIVSRNNIFDEGQSISNQRVKLTTNEESKIEKENDAETEGSEENSIDNNNKDIQREEEQPKRTRYIPKRFEDYEMNLMMALTVGNMKIEEVPENHSDAIERGWAKAIQEELLSHKKNKTWDIVNTPKNKEIIDSRWVFRQKEVQGEEVKKARLVARGFLQSELNEEVYAPVARMMTIKILLSLAVQNDMHIHQLDVKCAFLNGFLKQPVYMKIPEGVEGHNSDDKVYDLLLISKYLSKLEDIKNKLVKVFEMTDLSNELKFKFLGIDISKIENGLVLSQKHLINKVLKTFNMENCKGCNVPIQPKLNVTIDKNKNENCKTLPYRELIGYLMYIMLGTRPDLCFSVTYFSQFQSCYNSNVWQYLKQVLRYLKGTENYGLYYAKSKVNDVICAYVDADFANNVDDRKSLTGFMLKVFNNVVFWKTKKQATVALSSAEAEYIALSQCLTECIYVAQLLTDTLKTDPYPIKIFEDNQSSIKMASTFETRRTKHIDVKYHFVKDLVANNKVTIHYMPSAEQIADIFTKPLSFEKFSYFRSKLDIIQC